MKPSHGAASIALVAALSLVPCGLQAAYFDDFDDYGVGDVNGQGPWVDFGGNLTTDISVAQALSGTQSLALSTNVGGGYGSDVYVIDIDGAPVTSGQWSVSFSTFVPSAFDGEAIFYQSQGEMPGTFELGSRVRLNNLGGAGVFEVQNGGGAGGTIPLVFDQWAEVQMLINLDADTLDVFYNGSPVASGVWDTDNPGTPSIGGFNWWAQGGTVQATVHVDDLSFAQIPEHSTAILGFLGLMGVAMRRRRHC